MINTATKNFVTDLLTQSVILVILCADTIKRCILHVFAASSNYTKLMLGMSVLLNEIKWAYSPKYPFHINTNSKLCQQVELLESTFSFDHNQALPIQNSHVGHKMKSLWLIESEIVFISQCQLQSSSCVQTLSSIYVMWKKSLGLTVYNRIYLALPTLVIFLSTNFRHYMLYKSDVWGG